jgi:T5SS/PEP-CTERM-associated repeat protein
MRLKYPQIVVILFASVFLVRPGWAQRISTHTEDKSLDGSNSLGGRANSIAGPSPTFWIVPDGSDGSWGDAGNWSNGVPDSATDAQINNGGTARVFGGGPPPNAGRSVILGFGSSDSGNVSVINGDLFANDITVGRAGTGAVLLGGSSLQGNGGVIGELVGSHGAVGVFGSGWSVAGNLVVGQSGSGTLDVNGTSNVSSAAVVIGELADGIGMASVRGESALGGVGVTGTLSVGRFGTGTLFLADASNAGSSTTFIGELPGSIGFVTNDNYGRLNAGNLYIGGNASGSGGAGLLRLKNSSGLAGRLSATTTVVWGTGTAGGTGTIAGDLLSVSAGGALLGGDAAVASSALSVGSSLTLNAGSIIELVLGASGNHSSLRRTGGTWTFAPNQRFSFIDVGAQPGFYDNIITGLAADPGGTASWTIANTGFVGTFSYDGAGNIDLNLTSASGPALKLMSAVSRKTHGAAGDFDIPLPLTGEPGVECRAGSGAYKLVFTFNNDVVKGIASVTSGTGTTGARAISFAANTMTVNLTGVADVQKVTVTLINVVDSFSQVLPDTPVSMNVLVGDVTGDKSVNATDVAQAKSQSGSVASAVNFRTDINVNGFINVSDISQVKAHVGSSVP